MCATNLVCNSLLHRLSIDEDQGQLLVLALAVKLCWRIRVDSVV